MTLVNRGTLIQSGGSNTSPVTVADGASYVVTGGAELDLSGGAITAETGGVVHYVDAALSRAAPAGAAHH